MGYFADTFPEVKLKLERRGAGNLQVGIKSCSPDGDLAEATQALVQQIGGVGEIVRPGDVVMLKVNASHPRERKEGAVVDPQVAEAVARLVVEAGAKKVLIADAPSEKMRALEVFKMLGYDEVARKTGAELIDLNRLPLMRVTVPQGGLGYDGYLYSEMLTQVDVLISIAKLKTHRPMGVTLGIKNMLGMVPHCPVRGFARWSFHSRVDLEKALKELPNDVFWEDFFRDSITKGSAFICFDDDKLCRVITDLALTTPASLTLIDGVIGMEGNGPWRGTPVEAGFIVAGYDTLGTDVVAAKLMGFHFDEIGYFKYAKKRGLGEDRIENLELVGEPIERCSKKFERPSIIRRKIRPKSPEKGGNS
ncbi:MAG: hypothetical protein AMS15_01715 [Planctomycetes bacterium DG_23]|nr:MAG: hypothetical protein AMS15_01715 [Planctomycetes bacterium DG_23]